MNKFPASVLTTANAPYSKKLDAQALAYCLTHPAAAQAAPGQMSAFFGEVTPELQKEFASAFDISEAELVIAAKMFAAYSGESYPLTAPHRMRTLTPLYWRPVEAFLGMASGAFAAAVPQG